MSEVLSENELRDRIMLLGHELIDAEHFLKYANEIIESHRALQRRVEWTRDCPKEEGYYWMKDGSAEVIVHVCIGEFDGFHYENVEQFGLRKPTELSKFTGMLWAGPI